MDDNRYNPKDVSVPLDGIKYENNTLTDLAIDRTDLDREFSDQGRRYFHYAALAAEAKHRQSLLKLELDSLAAQLDNEIRAAFAQSQAMNVKMKLTETMCEYQIKSNPSYVEKYKEYLNMGRTADILSAGARAFEHRREMLGQLGANNRRTGSDRIPDPVFMDSPRRKPIGE